MIDDDDDDDDRNNNNNNNNNRLLCLNATQHIHDEIKKHSKIGL